MEATDSVPFLQQVVVQHAYVKEPPLMLLKQPFGQFCVAWAADDGPSVFAEKKILFCSDPLNLQPNQMIVGKHGEFLHLE